MVAAVEEKPIVKAKRKMPVSPGRGRAVSIPIPVRMRIRSLYVVQGLEPSQIAKQLPEGVSLDQRQISALCIRQGWTGEKKRVKAQIEADALSRTQEQLEEVVSATAMLAEEGSLAGLRNAIKCTESNGEIAAKKFAAWAAGSRQLVAIARQARGLDASDARGGGGNTTNNLSLFFMPASALLKPDAGPRNVTPNTQEQGGAAAQPAIDVSASVAPASNDAASIGTTKALPAQ